MGGTLALGSPSQLLMAESYRSAVKQPIRRVHNELAIQLACNTSVLSGLNFNC